MAHSNPMAPSALVRFTNSKVTAPPPLPPAPPGWRLARAILADVFLSSVKAPVTSEADLLTQARQLDARALGHIHDQYYPEIYRFALYRLSDEDAAHDLAAETFMRLLEALHAGRAPTTTLRGWLFGVAAHLVADHFRRKPTVPLADDFPDTRSPSDEAEQRWQQQAVRQAVHHLTPEQQDVLGLRFGNGFSLEQTAEALGKSITAVKALQFRAVEALRRALTHTGAEL